MSTSDDIKNKKKAIAALAAEIETLEKEEKKKIFKALKDITIEEKVKAFDTLHVACMSHIKAVENQKEREDDDHHMYEAVMQAVISEKVFDYINQFSR